jgi:hypothetical protein
MFKFTIRDLLLLTLVASMGFGWWLDRVRLTHQRAKSEEKATLAVVMVESLLETLDTRAPGWREAERHYYP